MTGTAKPQASDLEALIGYNLKRAYVIVDSDFRAALGPDGLSPGAFTALSLCVAQPGLTASALAGQMGIERSGLVAIVDRLEARGWLARTPVPGDRRAQALAPTNAGQTAYNQALKAVRAHEDRVFAALTEEEKETLLALLNRVRDAD